MMSFSLTFVSFLPPKSHYQHIQAFSCFDIVKLYMDDSSENLPVCPLRNSSLDVQKNVGF